MRPNFLYKSIYDDIFTSDVNYYRHTAPPESRPSLEGDVQTDVAVIGGGLSGLACAHSLVQEGAQSVTVIERHFIGWGASGRNGGQILPGYMAPANRIRRRYGFETTKKLWDISIAGVRNITDIIRTYNIDCDLAPGAISPVRPKYHDREALEKKQEFYDRLGQKVVLLDHDQTQAQLDSRPGYYESALLYPENTYHFHPLKYLQQLAAQLAPQVNIFEKTEVIGLSSDKDSVTLYTPHGKIFAKKVILCGDSYLGRLVPALRRKYVLIRNANITTRPLPDDIDFMSGNPCASEYGGDLLFYRKTADNRLMIGGGDSIRPNNDFVKSEEKIVSLLYPAMIDIFPQLKDVKTEFVWGGYIGVTGNYLPYTGCLDGRIYYMGGYSGHGVNLTHAIAPLIARAVMADRTKTESALDLLKTVSLPGQGDFDVTLARLGMALESILERFD